MTHPSLSESYTVPTACWAGQPSRSHWAKAAPSHSAMPVLPGTASSLRSHLKVSMPTDHQRVSQGVTRPGDSTFHHFQPAVETGFVFPEKPWHMEMPFPVASHPGDSHFLSHVQSFICSLRTWEDHTLAHLKAHGVMLGHGAQHLPSWFLTGKVLRTS